MTELREELRRAGRHVSPPEGGLEDMLRIGERRRRNARIGNAVVGGTLAVLVIAGSVWGLNRIGTGNTRPGEGPSDPRLVMGPEDYHYLKVVHRSPYVNFDGGSMPEADAQIETWWALDNSGRIHVDPDSKGYGMPEDGTFGAAEFPLEESGGVTDVSHLSTDPDVLERQLVERSANGGASPQPDITPGPGQDADTGKLVRAIEFLLEWPNVTPELRVALFHVASRLETVRRDDAATDPGGRPAIALRISTEQVGREWYFDPDTLLWMGTVNRHTGPITFASYTVVVASGFVGSTEATPTAQERFFPEATRLPTP